MEHTVTSSPIAHGPGQGDVVPFLGTTVTIKAPGWVEMEAPNGFGPPLHIHHREDEWFYVLEGEITVWVDGTTAVLPAGAFAYGPQDLPHTFVVTGEQGARFLMVTHPYGFEEFVRAASGDEIPSEERLTAIAAEYGIEFTGPPGIPG